MHMQYGKSEGIEFERIVAGMQREYSQEISESDIIAFSTISGDKNPIHLNKKYAQQSQFKKRIAHGMLSASFFSRLFGTSLPGPGSIYVSQSLKFLRPVYLGDKVTAIITVIGVAEKTRRIKFRTVCNVGGKVVIAGKAEIFVPSEE
jgi:3-hydroxybutyryl-CoA dehydratase